MLIVPLAAALVGLLAGCASTSPTVPTPGPTRSAAPSPTSSAIPTYDAKGTAEQNLGYFDTVGKALFASNPAAQTQGEVIVNWFVDHGFDKSAMEVTPDKTSIGLAAWNIEFSVKMKNSCLIGQAGNVGFQSYAGPVLATGKCLIGQTRTIDW